MVKGGAGSGTNKDQAAESKDYFRCNINVISPRTYKNGKENTADQHPASNDIFCSVGTDDFSWDQRVGGIGSRTDQPEKQGISGNGKPVKMSARTDDKGSDNSRSNSGCFCFLGEAFCPDTGDYQNDYGRKVLQDSGSSGIGIVNRHKKCKLCQTDTKDGKDSQNHSVCFRLPDGWMLGRFFFSAKNKIQKNKDQSGTDLTDAKGHRGRKGKVMEQILPGAAGKAPT